VYVPPLFKIDDREEILRAMRTNSFATLVTNGAGGLTATHLPILVETEDPLILAGHVSAGNGQKHDLTHGEPMILFQGPHQYISPSWYVTSPNVPTWNYVAVHAYGKIELVTELDEVQRHLLAMVDFFDPSLRETRPDGFESGFLNRMFGGLVAFHMKVERVDAKAKLNQNKPVPDRESVVGKLSESLADSELAEAMKRLSFG
jgi:transcriptional regulator